MSFATAPSRTLSPDEVRRYQDDGVVMIRQAIDPNWMCLLEAGVEKARRDMSLQGRFAHRNVAKLSPEIVVRRTLDAVRAGRPDVYPGQTRLLPLLLHLFPATAESIVAKS